MNMEQKLEALPSLKFEGVPYQVVPEVAYRGSRAREMPLLAKEMGAQQLYTPEILSICEKLIIGKKDRFYSLSRKQPLVLSGKMSEDEMAGILERFGDEVLNKYALWAELLDWQPEKRIEGYKHPKGKNAVLYRGWGLKGDEIKILDTTKIIPVNWMENSGDVSKKIVEQLGVPANTHVRANKKHAIDNYDGLNALLWDVTYRGSPELESVRVPQDLGSVFGALVGRRKGSYELELEAFGQDLDGFRKRMSIWASELTSIEERIANLEKMKPE